MLGGPGVCLPGDQTQDSQPDASPGLVLVSLHLLPGCLPEEPLRGQTGGPDLGRVPDHRRAWDSWTPTPIPGAETSGPCLQGPASRESWELRPALGPRWGLRKRHIFGHSSDFRGFLRTPTGAGSVAGLRLCGAEPPVRGTRVLALGRGLRASRAPRRPRSLPCPGILAHAVLRDLGGRLTTSFQHGLVALGLSVLGGLS